MTLIHQTSAIADKESVSMEKLVICLTLNLSLFMVCFAIGGI